MILILKNQTYKTYTIKHFNGKEVIGSFYKQEHQKTNQKLEILKK